MEGAEKTSNLITKLGRRAIPIQADVSKSDIVRSFVKLTLERFGQIDILVNNAAIRRVKKVIDITDEEWKQEIDVNLSGFFYCIREVAPHMIKRGKGRIINIGSVASFGGWMGRASYCAAKGGVLSLTKAVALELRGTGTTVNMIAPGYIQTALTRPEDEAAAKAYTLVGRFGKPEEIANGALYLASDDAAFVDGTILVIDGGFLAHEMSEPLPMVKERLFGK